MSVALVWELEKCTGVDIESEGVEVSDIRPYRFHDSVHHGSAFCDEKPAGLHGMPIQIVVEDQSVELLMKTPNALLADDLGAIVGCIHLLQNAIEMEVLLVDEFD